MSDCGPCRVYRIEFTTAKRCGYVINSRGWKCKDAPIWFIQGEDEAEPGRFRGLAVCDTHLEAMRCPEVEVAP